MKILLFYFTVTFFIIFMTLYIISPEKITIRMYPDPSSQVSQLYVDSIGTCYRYHRKEIECI